MKRLLVSMAAMAALAAAGLVWSRFAAAQAPAAEPSAVKRAIFAGGCFWCMEKPFDQIPGVVSTISGYSGGHVANPDYETVSAGNTGHAEVVQITYDPKKVSYARLLEVYWRNVDPFDIGGQFCDRGTQYRAAIFVGDAAERQAAEATKQALEKRFGKPIAVALEPASKFYAAEEYHQDYYRKNPLRYRYYRSGCGRDRRLEAVWGSEARGESPAGKQP